MKTWGHLLFGLTVGENTNDIDNLTREKSCKRIDKITVNMCLLCSVSDLLLLLFFAFI